MQLKKDSDDRERAVLEAIYKGIRSSKTLIIIVILVFLIGGSIGFGLGGFFRDSSSILLNGKNMAIGIFSALGWFPSQEEAVVEGIYYENYRLPINYIKGLMSNLEKITIDIGNNDFQRLAYQRELSLAHGSIVRLGDDYVPAQIHYKGQTVDVDLKLKGVYRTNHFAGDRWSFRIDVKGDDTLFGMQNFCIQDPMTRHYLSEWLYHKVLKREGVLAVRYFFINVIINGKNKGVYAVEENFDKRLIENNNYREGPIFKIYNSGQILLDQAKQTARNAEKFEQFTKAKQLVESFVSGSLDMSEVFDIEKFAKYMAISDLLAAQHAAGEGNVRFYYNPITSVIEPIGFDGHDSEIGLEIGELSSDHLYTTVKERAFEDQFFFEKYIRELERVSEQSYLDALFNELNDELQVSLNAIFRNAPWYHFQKDAFYKNQAFIRKRLNPNRVLYAGYTNSTVDGNITLEVANIQQLPVEILNVSYQDSQVFETKEEDSILQGKMSSDPIQYEKIEFRLPERFVWSKEYIPYLRLNYKILGHSRLRSETISPWAHLSEDFRTTDFIRQYPNVEEFDFLVVDNATASILIMPGNWELDDNLIIPAGYTVACGEGTVLDIKDNATILSYSPLQFIGTEENPIIIKSSDSSGQGITVLNTGKGSILENVVFQELSAPSQTGWELTGAITFYESPVEIHGCQFFDNRAGDDVLNIIRSEFKITNSLFNHALFDALDVDFGKGTISHTSFVNSGNDAMDFSGSEIDITNCFLNNVGDKGISVGEKSLAKIRQVEIMNSYVAVASKDMSQVDIENITISTSGVGFAVYQKKSEFGPSTMTVSSIDLLNISTPYFVEESSTLTVDNQKIRDTTRNVFELLYSNE
ncbi:CotH kinase family protein [Chloroflexota bacterium]